MFPYEETEDQMSAIMATKDDMESGKIMDRLICGDVGFGKTEVAIRAAFPYICSKNEGLSGTCGYAFQVLHTKGSEADSGGSEEGTGRYCHWNASVIVQGCSLLGSWAAYC